MSINAIQIHRGEKGWHLQRCVYDLIDEVVADANTIRAVDDPRSQEIACEVQGRLETLQRGIEKVRQELTQPLLAEQRQLKAVADEARQPLCEQALRLSRLVGDYQAVLRQRAAAEEAARNKALAEAEREREAALAKATTVEEIQEIKAIAAATVPAGTVEAPPRAEGQSVRTTWEITRVDEWAVLRARPDLVRKIELDLPSIKAELAAGRQIKGIEAREVTVSSMRRTKTTAIEIEGVAL